MPAIESLLNPHCRTEWSSIGPLQLSHHVIYFHKIMGCNFKNPRNGKSTSKTSKRPSLKPLALKKWDFMTVWILKKLRRFVWKKLLESKALLSSNYFHTNLLIFFEIQTTIKSHSLMLGTSNFAILVFSICSFHFWHSLSYSP